MTYHVTRDGAATLSALRSQAPLRAMRLPSRPMPSGGKLVQPKKPVEASALWRIEIYSNPTSPKSPGKLIYSQGPWHSDPAGVMKVVQAHLLPGRHARIYRQRKANEPAAGHWMHVQMPPGSPFDLAVSGLGQYNISVPQAETMTLPNCVPQEVKAWAQSQCQAMAPHGYDTLGQWGTPAITTTAFLPLQLDPYAFDWAKAPVCKVAALPVCPPPASGQPETGEPVPGDGEEEDSESSALVIGGLLLLVAIGGGYAYYKTRKK